MDETTCVNCDHKKSLHYSAGAYDQCDAVGCGCKQWVEPPEAVSDLERELAALLNKHSMEQESNTPDFIMAQFMLQCLSAWHEATDLREKWYGRSPEGL